MPGLTHCARALFIEVIRTDMLLNLVGDIFFLPYFGGAKRLAEGRPVGLRSQHVGGLAANNLRAFLEGADAHGVVLERYPAMKELINSHVFNTMPLEVGFSILWQVACAQHVPSSSSSSSPSGLPFLLWADGRRLQARLGGRAADGRQDGFQRAEQERRGEHVIDGMQAWMHASARDLNVT